ncbi:MAG: enoyl-CoA hydratase [Chloroflexi bacterium]|nr:enoyl-CoA hydratase [Chloroflexota bacterium]
MSETVLVEREEQIATVRLNRPEVLNALNTELMKRLAEVLQELDRDDAVRCIVITGNEKAFAAGADVTERFTGRSAIDIYQADVAQVWYVLRTVGTPVIAAVSGYAFGAGCELAMAADLIVCSDTAQFGQLEVNVGVIPGAGGTQRLTRAVGKYWANDMVLTGRIVKAQEALNIGLVSRLFPVASYLEEAKAVARTIASKPPLSVRLASELVEQSQGVPLDAGLAMERRSFEWVFATEDNKEGVDAFTNKRTPEFKGR